MLQRPQPTSQTKPTAATCLQPPHLGGLCNVNSLELIISCVSALGQGGGMFYSEEAPGKILPRAMAQSQDQPTWNHRKRGSPRTSPELCSLLGGCRRHATEHPPGVHTHVYTPGTHSYTPPSSPRAGCAWSLTFVQETCHIKGVFQKDLKESTELRVSGTALQRRKRYDVPLSFSLIPKRQAC